MLDGAGTYLAAALPTADEDAGDGDAADTLFLPVGATAHGARPLDADLPDAAYDATREVLLALQRLLADERFDATRLVVVTRGAVAADAREEVPDLAAAPVWGLVRTAQAEHPGRLVLVDLDPATEPDGGEDVTGTLRRALATGEPQLAIRGGTLRAPG
ncbi:hypothetical protein NKH77_47155 [Streptomyces sp. M19]